MSKVTGIFLSICLLISGCMLIPQTGQLTTTPPEAEEPATSLMMASPMPGAQLSETDQLVLTIPNPEPFAGREGEVRPNWLGWGAETFAVAPDGSFWIADTAVYPNRLLHYSPKGGLLLEISLENTVVYAYNLLVTQDSVWVLDISAKEPRIVQLDMDGRQQASVNIPREIMTDDGQFVSNGVFNLLIGDDGALLLDSVNGYYELSGATGIITARPLDALAYYGHTYQRGIYDQATGRLPIYVDGVPFETSPDFFVEVPFLGFNPDGSFAIAGTVEVAEHQIDHQVRYYSPSGELLGVARQRPQTFYKDWNHHLVFGPDASIYQLLSNPDHSVQIVRLGFPKVLPPILEGPILTPTPLTALLPVNSAMTDEQQARNVLLTFFADLSSGNYEQAATRYSGEKIEYARELMPGETMGEYWEYICTTVLWCIPVTDITATEQVSEGDFIFHVVFMQPDGRRFEIGACCGGDPAAYPPIWQFEYPVKKIDGLWKVMRGPLFTP
jgi:hypothetical protein